MWPSSGETNIKYTKEGSINNASTRGSPVIWPTTFFFKVYSTHVCKRDVYFILTLPSFACFILVWHEDAPIVD